MRTYVYPHRWFIGALLLVILAALPVLTYPMWRDHGMYANIARAILNGGTPYIDMWDIKPPPVYYIYAAGISIFGGSTQAIRAIDFVFVPLAMVGMYWLGTRIVNRRVGVLAEMLYGVFYFTETYASLTQSDSLVTLPMILAAVCAIKATDAHGRRSVAWSLMTGLMCGLILWFKQYFGFFVGALVIHHLWIRYRENRPLASGQKSYRPVFNEAVAFAVGGLVTGGGLLAYFVAKGMFEEMLIVARGTAAYNAQGYDINEFIASMRNYLYYRWRHWGVLITLVVLWYPVKRSAVSYQQSAEKQPVENSSPGTQNPELVFSHHSLVFLWIIAGLAFVLIQAKGFDTHWIPMMPALALLAAESLELIVQGIARIRGKFQQKSPGNSEIPHVIFTTNAAKVRIIVYAIATAGLLVIVLHSTWFRAFDYLTGRETRVEYFSRFDEGGDLQPAQSLEMVEWLQQRVAPGDTIYIWGFRPEVAYMGGWRPATRFQAQFPVVAPWYPPEWKQANVDILWAAMPPYVLVLEADYMPWVNGSSEDSHQLLVDYTELDNWLIANYERQDEKVGHFLIWKRRS